MADVTNNSGLLKVRLVTPDRVLLDATAAAVELPSMSGYMEALYGGATLLAGLVAWGFVEVLPERVTILAETALHPEEINVAEAQKELAHSQELWNQAGDDQVKYDEANAAARVAEEKLAAAQGGSQAGH